MNFFSKYKKECFKKLVKQIIGFWKGVPNKKIIIVYLLLITTGIIFVILSGTVKATITQNVFCSIGTGLIASLVVSYVIGLDNSIREKKHKDELKRILMNDIVENSIDIYIDMIHRINEYCIYYFPDNKGIYGLYDDFSSFNTICKDLEKVDYDSATEEQRKRLNKLFNINNDRIDYLVSELNNLSKKEFLLQGILTNEEYKILQSDYVNRNYSEYAKNINAFWNGEIVDIDKCMMFFRMTLYITKQTISAFSYAKERTKKLEITVKEDIGQIYFDQIYSQSDEYIENEILRAEAQMEYYDSHPEELRKLEEEYERNVNMTEEDYILENLLNCIIGFSIHDIDNILSELDPNSEKVKKFFCSEDVINALKQNRKMRQKIKKKLGKEFLRQISRNGL